MTYPGNAAISPEVQQRIRSTFEQTLGLAERGSRQEAALGCDFILQLDPQFRPALALQDRLRTSDGAVEVGDLRDELAGRAGREAEAAELFGGEDATAGGTGNGGQSAFGAGDDLDATLPALDDLPDLPELEALDELPSGPAPADAPATADDPLRPRLAELVAARRFEEALELAAAHRDAVTADPELARLATAAGERHEAAPYVERFLESATRARQRGDAAESAAMLEKARALDPSHPALAAGAGTPAATAPPPAAAPPAAAGPEPFADDLGDLGFDSGGFDSGDFGAGDFGSGDAEGDRRIGELLEEGQQAFDRGDHQGAIDAWSRIFLIDIDHQEASRRIEEARRLKSEQERKVEEVYHEALDAAEAGRTDEARAGFERVLGLAPGHAGVLEQLDRLETGRPLAPPPETPAAAERPEPPPAARAEPLKEEILVPPEPGTAPAPAADAGATRTMVATTRPTPRRFLLIGSLVLLLVLAGAWLLWDNRASVFPNADEAPAPGVAAEPDPIARATRLHESGRTAIAINQLRRLPPDAPQYEEAQALISQWEAEGQPAALPEPPAGAEDAAERQVDLLEQAAAAAAAGEHLRARTLLTEAETLAPLPAGSEGLKAEVDAAVAPLEPQIELMEMGEYSRALPGLWRLHQADPDNADVRNLIADSYYNLAVRNLQQGDAEGAAEHLEEALSVAPDDATLARHLRFAQTYAQRDKDLLYRIYVKYLPPR